MGVVSPVGRDGRPPTLMGLDRGREGEREKEKEGGREEQVKERRMKGRESQKVIGR